MTSVLGRFRLIEKVDACEVASSYTAINGDQSAWIEWLEAEVPDTAIQRLKDQRAALAKLKKAKAPEVIEFGEDSKRTYVAVKRTHGETLASRIRRGGLGALETLDLLIEVGEALTEAHALSIAHGRLTEKSIFFAAGGQREEIQILGFGLAGLRAGVAEQPKPQDDLRALGKLAYACLAGPEANSREPPARVLEKQPHLSKQAQKLVLRLLDEGIESASALTELARETRTVVTTDIAPIKPTTRDAAKIEVVLRATIEAANAEDPETATPIPELEIPLVRPRDPSQPRPPPSQPAQAFDPKLLMIAAAIIVLLILGTFIVASSGGPAEVTVEQLEPE